MFVLRKNGSWDVAVFLSRWLYLKIDLASTPKQRGARGRTCHSRVTTSFTSPVNCAHTGCPATPPLASSPQQPFVFLCENRKRKRGERIIPPKLHKDSGFSFLTARHWEERWSDLRHSRTRTECEQSVTVPIFFLHNKQTTLRVKPCLLVNVFFVCWSPSYSVNKQTKYSIGYLTDFLKYYFLNVC